MSDEPLRGEEEELEVDDLAIEALASTVATPPPPEVRARVLGEAAREADARNTTERLGRWRLGAGLAVAASALLALLGVSSTFEANHQAEQHAEVEQQNRELIARVEAQRSELELVDASLELQSELMRILSARRLMTATLLPGSQGSGRARVLLDADTGRLAVVGRGLPPPEAGRIYEVWAIRGDRPPVSAGSLVPAGERSYAIRPREVEDAATVTEFAISIEPAGGAPLPTGPIVLTGAVSGVTGADPG